jgi:hypothetical protein
MDVGPPEVGLGRTLARRPSDQISPDFDLILQAKTKQIQIKLLGFPWIPLAESGLFNGLQRIQIKNFFSLASLSLAALN